MLEMTNYLKQLRMSAIRRCYERVADRTRKGSWTYEQYLLEVIENECETQIENRIASNLPFSKWEQIFKDPMTTAAAINRLVHHTMVLELNLTSYRLEQSKEKKNIKNPT